MQRPNRRRNPYINRKLAPTPGSGVAPTIFSLYSFKHNELLIARMPPAMSLLRRPLIAGLMAGLLMLLSPAPGPAQERPVTLFAAASLKTALDSALADYKAKGGAAATVSYAASSALAKQIAAGAPADIFISADQDWMDHLAKQNLIRPESRVTLLGNQLVLVAKAGAKAGAKPGTIADLPALLGADGKLAMADTAGVPAGKYGKAALTNLGLWDKVQGRVAQAENVRAALALVARGEAPAGIVYLSDARAEPGVSIVAPFPAGSHAPIEYPAALLASSRGGAAKLLEFLSSPAARRHFEEQGFAVLVK